jgi:hypothetical protein
MKTLHTLGPWDCLINKDNQTIYIGNKTVGTVAQIPNNGKDRDEHVANANLVASIPELLEFIQRVANGQRGELMSQFISNVRREAKEVIAKATGEKEVQP